MNDEIKKEVGYFLLGIMALSEILFDVILAISYLAFSGIMYVLFVFLVGVVGCIFFPGYKTIQKGISCSYSLTKWEYLSLGGDFLFILILLVGILLFMIWGIRCIGMHSQEGKDG